MCSTPVADATPARTWSLAARLTAWYAGSAFALVLVTTAFLYWALVQNLDREDQQELHDPLRSIRALLLNGPTDAAAIRQAAEWSFAAQPRLVHVRILDIAGVTI